MVWRGSSTTQDRIFASLTYLVPLLEVLLFGSFLFSLIPPLQVIFTPMFLLAPIYFFSIGGMAIVPLVVFFALYLGVVRNEALSRFLRFNTLQALMLAVFTWLCSELLKLFGLSQKLMFAGLGGATQSLDALLIGVVCSALFIAIVAASVYSVVQSLRGQFAELPLISEAVYSQM